LEGHRTRNIAEKDSGGSVLRQTAPYRRLELVVDGEEQPIRRGDRGFLFRLIGAAGVVILLGVLVLGLMDQSRLGGCAAKGFQQLTDTSPSD
jgi:hypothetical protein